MTEATTVVHGGGCHCGRVRFEVDAPAVVEALECNGSMCAKAGYLHLTAPKTPFRLLAGADAQVDHPFNTGAARRWFCGTCGIRSCCVPDLHPDGIDATVRCLDGGTINALSGVPFDGRHREASAPGRALLS